MDKKTLMMYNDISFSEINSYRDNFSEKRINYKAKAYFSPLKDGLLQRQRKEDKFMKRTPNFRKAATFVLASLIAVCSSTGCSSTENTRSGKTTIKLSTCGAPAPYTYVDDNNEVVGYDIDLAHAVFDKLPQYELEVVITEPAAVLANVDADIVQMSANQWVKTEEREEKYLFSEPILDMRYVALFKKGSEHPDKIDTLADLAGLSTIGQPTNNTITVLQTYNEQNPDNQVVINYSEQDNAKMYQDVADGLYDFVLNNKVSYYYYQKTYGVDMDVVELGQEALDKIMNGEPYSFFILGAGQEQLQTDINGALEELVADGTVKELSEKYFNEDCSPYDAYKK